MMIADKDNAEEYIELIRAENTRMSHLVDDLLILAGSDTGKWTVRKSAVSMEEVLSSVYERVLPAMAQKHKTLELVLPETPLPIFYVDEERIIQILEILLSNAISYTPDGAAIELSDTPGGGATFTVILPKGNEGA